MIVLAEVQVLKGRRFGNLVIAASRSPLPSEWLPRLMAAGPHPAKVAQGAELEEFALGFGLTEGLLAEPAEMLGMDIVETEQGIELELEVVAACEAAGVTMYLTGARHFFH